MFDFKIYQDNRFLSILEDVYQIERVTVFDSNELDSITTFYRSKYKKGHVFNMPFNFYFSPALSPGLEQIFFTGLSSYSAKHHVNITVKSFYDYKDIEKKQLYAYNPIITLSEDYTHKFSKNLKQNLKRNYNKANKHSIIFKQSSSEKDLIDFYNQVLSVSYIDKHKMVFQPLSLFQKLLENDLLEMFFAIQDDHIVGGILCIKDQNILHYNWGASLNIQNIAIGTLVINHAIKYAYQNGYEYFDLGSTPLSDQKLLDFKLRWGATKHSVYEYYSIDKPQQIDLNESYMLIRNIYSKFPKSFLRWLMPKIIPRLVQ